MGESTLIKKNLTIIQAIINFKDEDIEDFWDEERANQVVWVISIHELSLFRLNFDYLRVVHVLGIWKWDKRILFPSLIK